MISVAFRSLNIPADTAACRLLFGEVAEWLKAPHSKCGIRATVSGVRIPPSPPYLTTNPLIILTFSH
jgi:hypothetical protein